MEGSTRAWKGPITNVSLSAADMRVRNKLAALPRAASSCGAVLPEFKETNWRRISARTLADPYNSVSIPLIRHCAIAVLTSSQRLSSGTLAAMRC